MDVNWDRASDGRIGGLAWKQSSVTLDQINSGKNIDFLELCQLFKRGWNAYGCPLWYLRFGAIGNEKCSERSSTKSSPLCACKLDMSHFLSFLKYLLNIKQLQATLLNTNAPHNTASSCDHTSWTDDGATAIEYSEM